MAGWPHSSVLLCDGDLHLRRTGMDHVELLRRCPAHVENPPLAEGATVRHAQRRTAAIFQVFHLNHRPDRQCSVCGGHRRLIIACPRGGSLGGFRTVPGRSPCLHSRSDFRRHRRNGKEAKQEEACGCLHITAPIALSQDEGEMDGKVRNGSVNIC